MPDHVHALLHFKQKDMLSHFMQQWKRKSSIRLKQFIEEHLPSFVATMNPNEPIWQPRFYNFNVFSGSKAREKLEYMHNNPVKNGLVKQAEDWAYGSARWYLMKFCRSRIAPLLSILLYAPEMIRATPVFHDLDYADILHESTPKFAVHLCQVSVGESSPILRRSFLMRKGTFKAHGSHSFAIVQVN